MIKNKSPATNSNQCLGRYADKLLMISKMYKMVYPQRGFTGLDMKRIHGGIIVAENENEFMCYPGGVATFLHRHCPERPSCLSTTPNAFMCWLICDAS